MGIGLEEEGDWEELCNGLWNGLGRCFVGVTSRNCYLVGRTIVGVINFVSLTSYFCLKVIPIPICPLPIPPPFLGVKNCPIIFLTLLCLQSLCTRITAHSNLLSLTSKAGYWSMTLCRICSLSPLITSAFVFFIGMIFRLLFRVFDLTIEH